MSQLLRTTITIPEDLWKMLKMRAVVEKKSVSELLSESANRYLKRTSTRTISKEAKKALGGFKLGIDKLYGNRDQLYEET